ncbi:hypothetical protein [Clostridium uliginosum]|uniref:Dolichyl-phosphate-mannose-protein mannosyltransferase n=1 Tax=Clostridium uliginosum TaxID=119641 RepID=A0A1I1H7D4_9CLOT|nr:hypothetical protein [Clostridium uliginosum]SFC19874.1 hypothetical protein SAMN05421842_101207 [Clostridium uliginosum]
MKKSVLYFKVNKIFNKINYPFLAASLVIIIGIFTLFVSPIIGMADNGDFYRVMNQNGVYHINKEDKDIFLGYFNKDYGIYKYNNDYAKILISTQSIFIKIAVFIDELFNKDYILDIRFMSALFLLIQATGIYLLVKVLINKIDKPKYKMIIVLLITLIFCDTGYFAYYNSFFGEGVNICCFLLSIGILMYMIEFDKVNVCTLFLFGVSSFLFFGAKQQLAPVGILIAFIFAKIGTLKKQKILKGISFILFIIFIISSAVFYESITGDFKYINSYHAMNRGILLNEDNPDEILKNFNISSQYSLLKDTNFFEETTLTDLYDKDLIDDYYKKFPIGKILSYYVTHPKVILKMAKASFSNSYSIRPEVIGNYEKKANKTFGQKSYFFALWSTFKDKIIPKNILFSLVTIAIYLYISIRRFIKCKRDKNIKEIFIQEAYFYIFLVGFSQVIISVIGAGDADLAKHVFMYNMTFDLIFIYLISLMLKKA